CKLMAKRKPLEVLAVADIRWQFRVLTRQHYGLDQFGRRGFQLFPRGEGIIAPVQIARIQSYLDIYWQFPSVVKPIMEVPRNLDSCFVDKNFAIEVNEIIMEPVKTEARMLLADDLTGFNRNFGFGLPIPVKPFEVETD